MASRHSCPGLGHFCDCSLSTSSYDLNFGRRRGCDFPLARLPSKFSVCTAIPALHSQVGNDYHSYVKTHHCSHWVRRRIVSVFAHKNAAYDFSVSIEPLTDDQLSALLFQVCVFSGLLNKVTAQKICV